MYSNKIAAVQQIGNISSSGNMLNPLVTSGQFPYSWICHTPVNVSRLFFTVTQTFKNNATALIPIQFVMQPVFNSSSGSVNIGSVQVPSTALAGQVYYKDINPEVFPASSGASNTAGSGAGFILPGQQLQPQWTGQPSSGAGFASFECEYNPEVPANWVQGAQFVGIIKSQ